MNPNIEVMFDATTPDADMFCFKSIDIADLAQIDEDEICLLECGVEMTETNNN